MKLAKNLNKMAVAGFVFGSWIPLSEAQVLLDINDGFSFGNSGLWTFIGSSGASPGTFPASGGSPGGYASLRALSSIDNSTVTGFVYNGGGGYFALSSLSPNLTFRADLRRTTGPTSDTPRPKLLPIIIQEGRVYQPASFIVAPESDQWMTVAPVRFNISEFTHSSGIPLQARYGVQVGFWLRYDAAPSLPSRTAYGVGIDNLSISAIPSPGALATLIVGLPLLARRRRSAP